MDPFALGHHRCSTSATHPGWPQARGGAAGLEWAQSLSTRDALRCPRCFRVLCLLRFFCSWEAAGEEEARGQSCFSHRDLTPSKLGRDTKSTLHGEKRPTLCVFPRIIWLFFCRSSGLKWKNPR